MVVAEGHDEIDSRHLRGLLDAIMHRLEEGFDAESERLCAATRPTCGVAIHPFKGCDPHELTTKIIVHIAS